jgi:hypothetical protein
MRSLIQIVLLYGVETHLFAMRAFFAILNESSRDLRSQIDESTLLRTMSTYIETMEKSGTAEGHFIHAFEVRMSEHMAR